MVYRALESSWNVMAHGDAREGKWRGNWRMEWVASTFQTTSQRGVSSISTADAHTLAVSSRLKWCPRRFKWTRPFCRKTKSGFCACAITFQLASIHLYSLRCLRITQTWLSRPRGVDWRFAEVSALSSWVVWLVVWSVLKANAIEFFHGFPRS